MATAIAEILLPQAFCSLEIWSYMKVFVPLFATAAATEPLALRHARRNHRAENLLQVYSSEPNRQTGFACWSGDT